MLVPPSSERYDGVRDFARLLASALRESEDMRLFTARGDAAPDGISVLRGWGSLGDIALAAVPRTIYLNYLPTSWLRADTLDVLRSLKHWRADGARVIIIAHEYQLDAAPSVKRKAARTLFRRMARAFARRADAFVTTHGFVAGLARADGVERLCPVVTIPAGSAVPEPATGPSQSHPPQLVMFGQPAGMHPEMTAAGTRAARDLGANVLWMCRRAQEAQSWMAHHGIDAGSIGIAEAQPVDAVSRELSRAAVGFAPVIDGVSTRRSTVAALLQHGLPVAGSDGRATDPVFRESPAFSLATVGDAATMAACVRRLLQDPASRDTMGREARLLFEMQQAWPRIASKYLELSA